ncbi:MAG: hypothetical protein EZS28_013209 [Streblomastix strix]|uniref:Uncharacterized protein n=1 Tax=Streblomastix strix TaxID=222440 RepID=A0A5J4W8K0_9EUKA|nr:MAG: hypothetical protein EZS28_013209 [Streblomastix strix]
MGATFQIINPNTEIRCAAKWKKKWFLKTSNQRDIGYSVLRFTPIRNAIVRGENPFQSLEKGQQNNKFQYQQEDFIKNSLSSHRTLQIGKKSSNSTKGYLYSRNKEQNSRFVIWTEQSWRLLPQEENSRTSVQDDAIHSYHRSLRKQKNKTDQTVLHNKFGSPCCCSRCIQNKLKDRIICDTSSNTFDRTLSSKNQKGKSCSHNDSPKLGRIILAASDSINDNQANQSRVVKSNSQEWSKSDKMKMGSASRRASSDFSIRQEQGRQGDELHRQAMKSIGTSDIAIENQIKLMKGSWRRHKTGLGHLTKYLQLNNISQSDLAGIKHPQIFIINFVAWLKTQRLSSSAILNVKTAISTLLISLGYPENKIFNNTTSISTKKERKNTANRIQDRETYNVDDILKYIRRRVKQINEMEYDELQGINIALIMTITTR